jgi:hypothetical protein
LRGAAACSSPAEDDELAVEDADGLDDVHVLAGDRGDVGERVSVAASVSGKLLGRATF